MVYFGKTVAQPLLWFLSILATDAPSELDVLELELMPYLGHDGHTLSMECYE